MVESGRSFLKAFVISELERERCLESSSGYISDGRPLIRKYDQARMALEEGNTTLAIDLFFRYVNILQAMVGVIPGYLSEDLSYLKERLEIFRQWQRYMVAGFPVDKAI